MPPNYPKSRQENIVVQDCSDELLIYDLKINKALCLNQTSAMIYQTCDGTKTISEISKLMSRKLKKEVSEDFVKLALNGLKKENLLENPDELSHYFAGLSRREAIKRVGFTSMVALPIISSIVAPSSVMAQSLLTLFQPCNSTPDCNPGLNCVETDNSQTLCCIGTNTVVGAPGEAVNTPVICAASQSGCNALASLGCCSGKAAAESQPASCPPGELICRCT
jgi:hypothetical protein